MTIQPPVDDDPRFRRVMNQIGVEELAVLLNEFDVRTYPPIYWDHYLRKRAMMAEVFSQRTGLDLPAYRMPPTVLELNMRMTAHTFPTGYIGAPLGEQLNSLTVARMASVRLSNADLLHLHSSPITILPPPGAGKAYIVLNSAYQCIGGNAAFVSIDQGPGLYYGTASGASRIADGGNGNTPFLPQFCVVQPAPVMVGSNVSGGSGEGVTETDWMDNAPIILANETTNMTGGGGATGRITVLYYVIDVF